MVVPEPVTVKFAPSPCALPVNPTLPMSSLTQGEASSEGAGSIRAMKRSVLPEASQFEVKAIKRPSFETLAVARLL
jgi:hypothetical protein